ncbi:MAG TPA: hypothetical protein VD886_25055, partial [Herpetosiphonaceae bacterium]|nr:hypothetical protein [Herpetosiphonaceae bacterium]
LAPGWDDAIFGRTRATDEVFALLTALRRFGELAAPADPREQFERREWLWAACNDLTGAPGWAYRFARDLTGVELDGPAEGQP